MSIGILTPNILVPNAYFAAEHLSKALNAELFGLTSSNLNVDHLIIIGMRGLESYAKLKVKNFKSVSVIFSDTNFCNYYKWCNEYTHKNNIPVYAMPDLNDYCLHPYIPAYQTITLPEIKIIKPTDRIVICHSPGAKAVKDKKCSKHIELAWNCKGTEQINAIIKELSKDYNIEYLLLQDLSWEKCIKAKSTAHIFIDQLTKNNPFINQARFGGKIHFNGALGKSGIEGMMAKCCTITTMDKHETEPYFPFPPVVLTDYLNFKDDLEILIKDVEYRNSLIEKQYAWAKKYCSPEFVAMNVTRHINETI